MKKFSDTSPRVFSRYLQIPRQFAEVRLKNRLQYDAMRVMEGTGDLLFAKLALETPMLIFPRFSLQRC
ncbi:MAG: hypothetical protein JOZ10_17625 [Acidobacteria bacterium]|nr:hypothetical protein [Acidobacteriota bacterium]MBV9147285.1 hypothetical protein [Acidobacteriota bacterium]